MSEFEMETRLQQEGVCVRVSSDSVQLDCLWRLFVEKENSVKILAQELEDVRAEHAAEIDRVQLYIQNVQSLSKERDSMALELEQENETLRLNLTEINLQQEAERSEIAEMLVQQGLTEVTASSLSEQVAYLLADRAALMERIQAREDPDSKTLNVKCTQKLITDENKEKGAPVRGRSPWKRLLSFRKAAPANQDDNQADEDKEATDRERRLLQRDLIEASTRLDLAHDEIRRLTDELESARLTTRTYESELREAQVETEQLRLDVEKLKHCELAEAEEMSSVLDAEVRRLSDSVDGMCAKLLELLDRNFKELDREDADFVCALTRKPTPETVLRKVPEECDGVARRKEAEQPTLQLQDKDHNAKVQRVQQKLEALIKEVEQLKSEKLQHDLDEKVTNNAQSSQDVLNTMLQEQENLKLRQDVEKLEEFSEKLQVELQHVHCTLHSHVRKYDEMKARYRDKLVEGKQVFLREMTWRDQMIKEQKEELDFVTATSERKLMESDMVKMVTAENEALLLTKKTLLCQLNEAEENRKYAAARISALQLRVDFLEKDSIQQWERNMEKSTQIARLERRLSDSIKSTRYLKKPHGNHILKSTKEQSFRERGFETSITRKTKGGRVGTLELSGSPSLSAGSETGYVNIFTHNLG